MKSTHRVTVYPYSIAFAPYLTPWGNRLLAQHGIHIQHLVSPLGFGLSGNDAGTVDRRDETGILVESDVAGALRDSDALLLVPSHTDALRADMLRQAQYALSQGITVLSAIQLTPVEQACLRECATTGLLQCPISEPESVTPQKEDNIYPISTPIICVGEMLEGANGTDVTLALWDYYMQAGYRCSVLMSDGVGALLGATDISQWFYNSRSYRDTIQALNMRLHSLDVTAPDIMIIQIPGTMFALNKTAHGDFGAYTYMLSQAISADSFILCSPYQAQDNTSFDHMAQLLHYRFMLPLDYIHMSNMMLDISYMQQNKGFSRLHVTLDDVGAFLDERCSIDRIGNVLRNPEALFRSIDSKFQSYAQASNIT